MNFALSDDQVMFKSTIRKLFDQYEQTALARKLLEGDDLVIATVYSKLTELGATAISISEDYGGLQLATLDTVPVLEEIGRALYPGNYAETIAFAAQVIERFGTVEQKEAYLPGIAAGEMVFSLASIEPQKTFNFQKIDVKLTHSQGTLQLNGVKTIVPTLLVTHFIVVASDDEKRTVLCIVPVEKTVVQQLKSFDQTTPVALVKFDQVALTEVDIIRHEDALDTGLKSLNAAISAIQVGAMERIVEMTSDYAKIREQFGQPIGRFQAVKHKLADMKVELEIARSLSHYASWAVDTESSDIEEAVYSARAYSTDAFIRIAAESIQLHGGIGFTEELDCHLYVKRSRFYENYLGTVTDFNEKIAVALNL